MSIASGERERLHVSPDSVSILFVARSIRLKFVGTVDAADISRRGLQMDGTQ